MSSSFTPHHPPLAPAAFAALFPPTRETAAAFTPPWDSAPSAPEPLPSAPPLAVHPEDLLAEAREQAAEILRQARATARQEVEEVNAEAREQTAAQQRELFQQASAELLESLRAAGEEQLQHLEREAALTVTAIARRVLENYFTAQPESLVPVVRAVLQRLAESSRVRVVVHESHQAALRAVQHELAALLGPEGQVEVVIGADLEPGGCLAHGDRGSLDARLSTRLEALESALREVLP